MIVLYIYLIIGFICATIGAVFTKADASFRIKVLTFTVLAFTWPWAFYIAYHDGPTQ